MKIIKLNYPHSFKKEDFPPLSMALGYFDGVHLGHQKVILTAKEAAKNNGLKTAVMTFDPHPSVVLGKATQPVQYITPLEDKMDLIEKIGVDYLFIVHFTLDFANLLPQEFIDEYVIGLNVKYVVAGFDYTYGKMGKGTMETIQFHSRDQFKFTTVPKLSSDGEKISSTIIRSYLREGKMDCLPAVLGRHYTTNGVVVHGDQRGRTIGFPTANVEVSHEYILPPTGVYTTRILIDGHWHNGVCNLGYKPTFKKDQANKPTIEVHIFNFASDIYGKTVTVEWYQKLREEQKFSGIDELVEQISRDKERALVYFEKHMS